MVTSRCVLYGRLAISSASRVFLRDCCVRFPCQARDCLSSCPSPQVYPRGQSSLRLLPSAIPRRYSPSHFPLLTHQPLPLSNKPQPWRSYRKSRTFSGPSSRSKSAKSG
ncbi:uncharacterized protein BKA78DRAFT_319466 [Phyllosticta capitalensis]|uniref:uncharacterized protein n=1 Tax=Phyllosticta capitalensis TaxID=121624 RepID=UPI0031321E02